jgi:exodeoxyribonuclease VII large subunit
VIFLTFEKLKKSFLKRGFLMRAVKRNSSISQKIGIVTSPTGAAIRDIINVAKRKFKYRFINIPFIGSGEKASMDLIKGIEYFDNREDIDLIILARGGGSIEELWAFNNENLAYAVYNCSSLLLVVWVMKQILQFAILQVILEHLLLSSS